MVNTTKITLWTGVFLGGLHLLRAACVAIMPTALQNFLNRIFGLHFLQPYRIITPFELGKMLMLVGFTFVIGCIIGWIMSLILNCAFKK